MGDYPRGLAVDASYTGSKNFEAISAKPWMSDFGFHDYIYNSVFLIIEN